MKFSHPHILFLLWGLLPLAGIMVYGIHRHRRILARFADPGVYAHILPGFTYTRRWIRIALALAAFCLALVALAGLQAGFRWEKTTQKGVDLMIALDCSRSMLAQDVSPTRLTRAKREIIDLTRLLRSDRAGLVAFSGQALLQCPLTLDYQAFQIFLDALDPDYLPVGGTNLTAALKTCYNGFDPDADTEKAIILITDGEDTAGGETALDEVAQTLANEKIRIFAIGVGNPEGAPIPGKSGGFEKDGRGNIILSRVDETTLQKITAMTGGRYVRSVAGDMDLELIYTEDILNTMERKRLTQGRKKVWEKRFQWALFPAVLLFLLELILPDKPVSSGYRPDPRTLAGLVLVAVCASLAPGQAEAGIFSSPVKEGIEAYEKKAFNQAKKAFIDAQLKSPDDLRLYYNIGTAAYGAGEYDLAASNFSQAATSEDSALRNKALFNLANTRYRQGDFTQAINAYETLLKEFPDDVQARENLAFVRQKEKERTAREKNQQQGNKDQNPDNPKDQGDKDQANKDQANKNRTDKNQAEQKETDPAGNREEKKDQSMNQEGDQSPGNSGPDPENLQASNGEDPGNQNPENTDPGGQTRRRDEARERTGEQGAASAASGGTDDQDTSRGKALPAAEAKLLENRLNRLADKPGMALIPQTGARTNGKDW